MVENNEEHINFDLYMPTPDATALLKITEGRLRQIAKEKQEKPIQRYGLNWWRREWVEQVARERAGKEADK